MDEIEELYNVVYEKGLYTKSFDEFKTKYSDTASRDKLFSVVSERGYYTKSKEEFSAKYFSSTEKKNSADSLRKKKCRIRHRELVLWMEHSSLNHSLT
jgi:hypothetical protein